MSSGNRAFGAILTYTAGAKVIGEITNIGGVELSADTIELTNHQSTSRYREFVQGLRDGGEVAIEGNHVPGDEGQAQILTHFDTDASGGVLALTLVFIDDSDWAINAIVTRYKAADAPVDGKLAFSATLKITGKPSFTAT